MGVLMKQGKSLDDIIARYHLTLPTAAQTIAPTETSNGVIDAGPVMSFDRAQQPASTIDTNSIAHTGLAEQVGVTL
jgi:hypothetical protein